jgi:hypothetical protein
MSHSTSLHISETLIILPNIGQLASYRWIPALVLELVGVHDHTVDDLIWIMDVT